MYEMMFKNMVEADRPQVTIKRGAKKMRFTRPITNAKRQTLVHNTEY